MMNKLAMFAFCEIILEKLSYFLPKILWNSGAHYACMRIILNKMRLLMIFTLDWQTYEVLSVFAHQSNTAYYIDKFQPDKTR